MFLYLLNISLMFQFVQIAVIEVAFLQVFLFIVEVPPSFIVGLDQWLVNVSWLGKLASVLWLVELDLFSLGCNEVSNSEFCGVSGFDMTLGSLSFNAQGCVPALLENQCGTSCSGTCWLLGGAWFQCRYGDFWMSSC